MTRPFSFTWQGSLVHADQVFGSSKAHAVNTLCKARDAYFEQYKLLGIPETAMRNLTYTHHGLTPGDAFRVARGWF